MQYWYLHFNKCGGTALQHALRTRMPERQFGFAEYIPLSPGPFVPAHSLASLRMIHDPRGTPAEAGWVNRVSFAIFRDPVERAFSDFKMVTRWTKEDPKSELQQLLYELSLSGPDNYFRAGIPAREHPAFNLMTLALINFAGERKWLNDYLGSVTIFDPITIDPIVNAALRGLSKLTLLFTMDQLSDAFAHISRALPVRDYIVGNEVPATNAFHSKAELQGLTPETRGAIEACNQIDAIVYAEALKKIAAQDSHQITNYLSESDDSLFIDASDFIPFSNVWPREVNPNKFSFWTGSNPAFNYRVKNARDKIVCAKITNCISQSQIDNLYFSIGNIKQHPRVERIADGSTFASTRFSVEEHSVGSTVPVSISCPTLKSPNPIDSRELGVEITNFSIISDW